MNITEENNSPNRPNVFGYCPPTQWSQIPPQYMPWGHNPASPAAPLVTFNAQPQQNNPQLPVTGFGPAISEPQPSTSSFGQKAFIQCKRKANLDIPIPSKQHITEEKMAAHMSRLHISTESQPGGGELTGGCEDRLTRQKRLYVCEEMRRLQTESILPTSLLGRLERPCMAVMLWQPPAKIPGLLSNTSHMGSSVSMAAVAAPRVNLEEDENDNNAATADLNNMDMEA